MIKNNLRKKWIINKKFQYNFVSLSLLPIAASLLTFWVSVEILFYFMIQKGHEMNLPATHAYYELLNSQKHQFFISTLCAGLIISLIFGSWAIVMSHKIAGPLYRLSEFLKKANRETLKEEPPLKFRDADYFKEIADEVNEFLKRY